MGAGVGVGVGAVLGRGTSTFAFTEKSLQARRCLQGFSMRFVAPASTTAYQVQSPARPPSSEIVPKKCAFDEAVLRRTTEKGAHVFPDALHDSPARSTVTLPVFRPFASTASALRLVSAARTVVETASAKANQSGRTARL